MSDIEEKAKQLESHIGNLETEAPKLRRYLKDKKGFTDADINSMQSVSEAVQYHQEMVQERQASQQRLQQAVNRRKQPQISNPAIAQRDAEERARYKRHLELTPDDKLSPQDKITRLLLDD